MTRQSGKPSNRTGLRCRLQSNTLFGIQIDVTAINREVVMKPLCARLLFAALTFAVATLNQGCASTQSARRSDNIVNLVDDYMAAWNAHDAARAAAFFDENIEYYDASVGASQHGKANAQKNVVEAFLQAVPDAEWKRDAAPIVGNDAVAFQWTFSGTNTGDWSDGTKATGKTFTVRGATLIRLSDNKIVFQADYYDAYAFFKQLGLAK